MDVLFPSPYKKYQSKQNTTKKVVKKDKEGIIETIEAPEQDEKAGQSPSKPSDKQTDQSKCFPLFNYDNNENLW